MREGTAVILVYFALSARAMLAQDSAPNVSEVLVYSTTGATVTASPGTGGAGTALPRSVTAVYSEANVPTVLGGSNFGTAITDAANYKIATSVAQIGNALNASIASALSIVPLASPASGVIFKTDSSGTPVPASGTLGTIFTERAETIGKNHFYIGITHQDFHFTEFNGESLNSLTLIDPGGYKSSIGISSVSGQTLTSVPTTFNLGVDVRLSQDVAFLTYGVTDRLDVSVGLPMVHASVNSRTYDGQIWAGDGLGHPTCWCADTFTPGAQQLTQSEIGSASHSATGFGDLLLRVKGTVFERPSIAIAVGADLRFATGDASNFLGTGATSVKPFTAISFYTHRLGRGIILAPHINAGWQFIGKSTLGGTLQGTDTPIKLADGSVFTYEAAPFTSTKAYLPDVFSWALGSEIGLGKHFTLVADVLGNQIGWIHGIENTKTLAIPDQYPPGQPNSPQTATGLVDAGRVSFGQYSGAFGWKAQVAGNLVFTFNALVRFDNNGLTARFAPLYGLGYSF